MEKYSDFMQFSRDLYLHRTDIPFPGKDLMLLKPSTLIQTVSTTLSYFCDAFCSQFYRIYDNCLLQVLKTEEQLLKYTISRCLNLFHADLYYLSLLLVAAFIGELEYYLENYRCCHRYSGAAYKCLTAVFNRRFQASFEERGGFRGLESFCDGVNNTVGSKMHLSLIGAVTGFDSLTQKRVFDLIEKCDVVPDKSFSLDEYELFIVADDIFEIETELKNSNPSENTPLEMEWIILKDTMIDSSYPVAELLSTCLLMTVYSGSESTVLESAALKNEPLRTKDMKESEHEPMFQIESSSYDEPHVNSGDGHVIWKSAALKNIPLKIKDINESECESMFQKATTIVDEPRRDDSRYIPTILEASSTKSRTVQETTSSSTKSRTVQETTSSGDKYYSATNRIKLLAQEAYRIDKTSENDSHDSESGYTSSMSDLSDLPDLEDINGEGFGNDISILLESKNDQQLSAHLCEWCGTRCYQLKKYFFLKHYYLYLERCASNKS